MRVAVTRPRHRAAGLCALLRSHGFVPLLRGLVRIESDPDALTPMIRALRDGAAEGRSQWLVLTSVEAMSALYAARHLLEGTSQAQRVDSQRVDWPAVRVACVGPATAEAAKRAGLNVAIMPSQWDARSLADAMQEVGSGATIYWPRAQGADLRLKRELGSRGVEVIDAVAYRTVPDQHGGSRLARDLRAGRVDAVLLLSPSAVDAYAAIDSESPKRVVVGVIGHSTCARAEQRGIVVDVEPAEHSVTALVEALRQYADRRILESGTGE